MAIGVSNFPIVDNNLAKQLLGGFKAGQGLHQSYLANQLAQIQNQQEQTKAKYIEPSLQQQLQKAIYENMIQKPMAENADQFAAAKLAFQQAQAPNILSQTELNRANIPFINAKTQGKNLENQFYPDLMKANIANKLSFSNTRNLTPLDKELGKQDAKLVSNLDQIVLNGKTKLDTLNEVSNIVTSPIFKQIRENPIFGKQELSYYSKFGTPDQQNAVGQYLALSGNIIKDAAQDFKGQFRKGEQSLLESMKPTASDTADTAVGKIQALILMTRMLTERSRKISELIRREGKSPIEAEEEANNKIDSNQIRQEIQNKLTPKISIKNKKTGEERLVTQEEARKLGAI